MSESASEPQTEESEGVKAGKPAAPARSSRTFGGLSPAEAAERSARVRREKASQRAALQADRALTVRQRLALALSETLTVDDWKAVIVKAREKGDTAALARMADQAFGKPLPEEGDNPADVETLTRGERAALLARLRDEEEKDGTPLGDPSDPRAASDPPAPPQG